jgi:hypothetical protein
VATPPRDPPKGFYQYAFSTREFAARLTDAHFRVNWVRQYAILYGFADTAVGSRFKDYLQHRFGSDVQVRRAKDLPTRENDRIARLRRQFRAELRSVYDERDDSLLSRSIHSIAGPLVAHMVGFGASAI